MFVAETFLECCLQHRNVANNFPEMFLQQTFFCYHGLLYFTTCYRLNLSGSSRANSVKRLRCIPLSLLLSRYGRTHTVRPEDARQEIPDKENRRSSANQERGPESKGI